MKKIKVSEATNIQLDWLVAKCEGYFDATGQAPGYWESPSGVKHFLSMREPHDPHLEGVGWTLHTTNPAAMWPIIENMVSDGFELKQATFSAAFQCIRVRGDTVVAGYGPTLLIAAARCYVVSKLGEEVEVPEELS